MKKKITLFFLYPFSMVYAVGIWIRNGLYKTNFLGSTDFEIPIICVGNLQTGGTGKTPFIEYLITILGYKYKVGIISRGYKRKTLGFLKAETHHTSEDIGDEPLMLKLKFPDIAIAVGEARVVAIPRLLIEEPATQIILMDDGFQHKAVRPHLNIILSTQHNLFFNDYLLPAGNLRDFKSEKQRANIFIITKCNENITELEQQKIIEKINPTNKQKVFFTTINYGIAYNIFNNDDKLLLSNDAKIILLTGIANAQILKNEIEPKVAELIHFDFNDHHYFTKQDLEDIKNAHQKNEKKYNWLCTEKDAVKLALYKKWFYENKIELYTLPINIKFLNNEMDFKNLLFDYLKYYFKEEENTTLNNFEE